MRPNLRANDLVFGQILEIRTMMQPCISGEAPGNGANLYYGTKVHWDGRTPLPRTVIGGSSDERRNCLRLRSCSCQLS